MKLLKDSLEQLYQSQKLTPQEQRDAVIDVSRRGFLKQALSATLYGVAIGTCTHKVFAEGINGLPDLGDNDRSNLTPYEADQLGHQVILNIYSQGSMLEDYDSLGGTIGE